MQAMSYYRQASMKGSGAAAHNLALLLMAGGEPVGGLVPLLEQACARGVPPAHALLGVLRLEAGRQEEAASLFQRAAEFKVRQRSCDQLTLLLKWLTFSPPPSIVLKSHKKSFEIGILCRPLAQTVGSKTLRLVVNHWSWVRIPLSQCEKPQVTR